MFIKTLRTFAQGIGYTVIGGLMLYGAVAGIKNVDGVFAANPSAVQEAAANEPASAPQLQVGLGTVPSIINYQGTLRDPEGNPLSGPYAMTFRIYADVTAPTTDAIWTGEYNEVTVRDGHFSVVLGDSTPLPADVFTSPDRFIGITVDPYDEMVPRQRFASVPYAMHSAHADKLDGNDAAAFAMTDHRHSALDGANGGTSNALYVANNGNVGVGTTNPLRKLHVNGDRILLQNGTDSLNFFAGGGETFVSSSSSNININATDNGRVILNGSATSGNVGIGKTNPQAKLDVAGDIKVNGSNLIMIFRYENVSEAEKNTGIVAADWNCTIGGWAAAWDFDEDGTQTNRMWTFTKNGRWHIGAEFASHNNHEIPDVDMVCFRTEVSIFFGEQSLNEAN
ncbi:MAG: hypothetical protein AAF702_07130 [Chloroflexota bacterium]